MHWIKIVARQFCRLLAVVFVVPISSAPFAIGKFRMTPLYTARFDPSAETHQHSKVLVEESGFEVVSS